MHRIAKTFINILGCHILYRVQYENIEVLEKENKAILCPNHSHIFDPVWIYPKIENLYIMAKSEIFKNKIIEQILYYFGVFPVKRGKKNGKSILTSIKILESFPKVKLLLFPEGKIIKTREEVGIIQNGATYLAAKTDLAIIPIFITRRPRLFSKVIITFKEPIKIGKEVLKDKNLIKEASKKLLNQIYEEK